MKISAKLRKTVAERAEGVCEYCKMRMDFSHDPFEVEHINPISNKGKTEAENLALSCRGCKRIILNKIMNQNLPNLQQLLGHQSDKLSGIKSWSNVEILGKNNLQRITQLAQENIYRMLSDHEDAKEMKLIHTGIDFIQNELLPKSVIKPTLPKLRNEMFRKDNFVYAYLGDTNGVIIEKGWIRGQVVDVSKAFNKDWKDGKANSGYFWKVTVEAKENIFTNSNKIVFSTTEPRVILDWEYDYLKIGNDLDFLQIFSNNAFREWKPLWCIEKNLECHASEMNMTNWIQIGKVIL